ncbi:MAG: hypothetical protein IJS31_04085 [Oscillospiraceae bacterium]|nr:hypothetical protein [Oscillospiraceae bacterium]
MNFDKKDAEKELESFLIGGRYEPNCDIMEPFRIGSVKGGGSAFGGKWRPNPNKPDDARFLGEPGEIKTTILKAGYRVDTKIGKDGRATMERHYTNHNQPWAHTDPHDHIICWDNPTKHPDWQSIINYPNGAPEFKCYGDFFVMKHTIIPSNSIEQNRFVTISDFKDCMRWHGEVEFLWNDVYYSITPRGGKICISHSCLQETEKQYETADDALEHMVGEDRLRDVITKVKVLARTI